MKIMKYLKIFIRFTIYNNFLFTIYNNFLFPITNSKKILYIIILIILIIYNNGTISKIKLPIL